MCFEVIGTILGIVVFTLYYVLFVQDTKEERCEEGEREPDQSERRAYRYHALTLGIILIACIVTTFLGVREQKGGVRLLASAVGLCINVTTSVVSLRTSVPRLPLV